MTTPIQPGTEAYWAIADAREQPDKTPLMVVGTVKDMYPVRSKTSRAGANWTEHPFMLMDSTGQCIVVANDPTFQISKGDTVHVSGKADCYMGRHSQSGAPEQKFTLKVGTKGLIKMTGTSSIAPGAPVIPIPVGERRGPKVGMPPGPQIPVPTVGVATYEPLKATGLLEMRKIQETLFNEWLQYSSEINHQAIAAMVNTLIIAMTNGKVTDDITPKPVKDAVTVSEHLADSHQPPPLVEPEDVRKVFAGDFEPKEEIPF